MMLLKPGVSLKHLQPQTIVGMMVVNAVLQSKGMKSFMITSCNDSTHMKGSLHYDGLAFDIRTHDIILQNREIWLDGLRNDLKIALTAEFDVILEDPNGPNEHIHVEYDPKQPVVVTQKLV